MVIYAFNLGLVVFLISQVPDTVYALDHMRPDMILLMVLGSALIMWDNIAASQDWIVKQLPPLLNYSLPTILDNMLSSAAGNTAAGQQETDSQTRSNTTPDGQTLDWGAIGLAHVHALSGACFAIGLRFAGTCNAAAEALLRQHLLQLLHAKRRAPGGPNDQSVAPVVAAAAAAAAASPSGVGVAMAPAAASVGKLDKQAIENSMCTVLLSLSLVMAGSGHLPTFRLVQVSRHTCSKMMLYRHMLLFIDSHPLLLIHIELENRDVNTPNDCFAHPLTPPTNITEQCSTPNMTRWHGKADPAL